MAVKIEQYQDRLSPSGLSTPQARGAQISGAVGEAMQNLGQAGQYFSSVNIALEKHNQALLKQKEEADAITDAGKKLSDANIEWNKWLEEKQRTAPAGAPGFYEDVDKEYNAWREKTLTTITEPKARQYAERTLNNQRDNVLGQALRFQAKAGVDKRLNDLEDTTRNYEAEVGKDATRYEFARTAVLGVIANDPTLDANTKADVARKITDRLTTAAVNGKLQLNPQMTRDALLARLGKTALTEEEETQIRATGAVPQDQPKFNLRADSVDAMKSVAERLGISAQDLQTIIGYETGGTFSPSKKGGKGGAHLGLIQFGPNEQKQYGVNANQSFAEQMQAVEKYLRDRGVRPGDDLKTLYKIVNGGNRNVPDTANDGNGTITEHVAKMQGRSYGAAPIGDEKSLPAVEVIGQRERPEVDPALMALIDQLPQQQVIPMLHAAQAEVNRQMATYQSALKTREADDMVKFANGEKVDRPITEGEYQKVYGPVEGSQRFSEYAKAQQLGVDINTVKTLPVDQQQAFLEGRRPDPNKPGYALATQRYQMLAQAMQTANTNRAADPIAWAAANKVGDVQGINFNDMKAMGAELAKRAGVAATMQQSYGTGMVLLSKAEQQTFVAGLGNMTTQQKLDYLKTMRSAVKDPSAYRALIQQIAPDSPVTAIAGALMAETRNNVVAGGLLSSDTVYRPDQVAGLILEGEQLLNPSKGTKAEDGRGKPMPMPQEKDLRQAFADQMGNAFAGNVAKGDIVFQAVKAYYAAKSAREGDVSGNFDSSRMKEAIQAVTGGATEINGKGSVIRPWGMSETYFKDQAKKSFDAQIKANGYTGGMFDQWGAYGLQNLDDPGGQGRDLYLVKTGTGYLFGRDGKPMVLDLTQAPSQVGLIPTGPDQEPAAPALPAVPQKPEKPGTMTTTKPKTK